MRCLILGAGYVGSRLLARRTDAVGTTRDGRAGTLRFSLDDETTWHVVPRGLPTVWTFAATDAARALRFRDQRLGDAPLIVLGSTSAYRTAAPDAWVDEGTPLDLSQPRVQTEEALRVKGATVLQLAGIWGPERDPIQWLLGGRIRNGDKYVNLAHVDDILATIDALSGTPRPGVRINVCDGEPRRWREHVAALQELGTIPPGFVLPSTIDADSKRVRNDLLRSVLPGHPFVRLT